MDDDTIFILHQPHFGKVAEFTFRQLEDGGYTFQVTAPSWEHGNLATEWITRRMGRIGLFIDPGCARPHVYPKWCRCGSRKRYKKLVTAAEGSGIAALWCDFFKAARTLAIPPFKSYQEAWLNYIFSTLRTIEERTPADNPETGSE